MSKKITAITVQDISISVASFQEDDYICITDMAKARIGESRAADIIKKWIESTNAIGIYVQAGRYGGTYAHKDIAFEFGSAISPVFKLYLIKEYQRLKNIEYDSARIEWTAKRFLSKANYLIHTDAVKNYVLPNTDYTKQTEWLAYADEADLLNVALFGFTANQWREANPELAKKNNVRDFATINELTVLSNLETHNAEFIKEGKMKADRFQILVKIAQYQLSILDEAEKMRRQNNLPEMKQYGYIFDFCKSSSPLFKIR